VSGQSDDQVARASRAAPPWVRKALGSGLAGWAAYLPSCPRTAPAGNTSLLIRLAATLGLVARSAPSGTACHRLILGTEPALGEAPGRFSLAAHPEPGP
jgi:hypothetical protein